MLPDPYYVAKMSIEDFILGMVSLGKPLAIGLVGIFKEVEGRGSQQKACIENVDLPLHQDGGYSKKVLEFQGSYVSGIDIVGFYCLREATNPVYTLISEDGESVKEAVDLKRGDALIIDNRRIFHGRTGLVGKRILIRFYVTQY